MTYKVSCGCGKQHLVTTSQAGGELNCSCGRPVSVPRLSELRISAGQTAHRMSVVEQINGMIKRGELPGQSLCTGCGRFCDQTVWLYIQCEKSWSVEYQNRDVIAMFFGFVTGILSVFVPQQPYRPDEVLGRELSILVPLALCSTCLKPGAKEISQRFARKHMRNVPVYTKLLKEYTNASIVLDRIAATGPTRQASG